MSQKQKLITFLLFWFFIQPLFVAAQPLYPSTLTQQAIAKELGWIHSTDNHCGGYYLNNPFLYPQNAAKKDIVEVKSDQVVFSQQGTSILQGKISINYGSQEITSSKAYLYRNPDTQKLASVEFVGDVTLRAPDNLVIAKQGTFQFQSKEKTLRDILYRTKIYLPDNKKSDFSREELQSVRYTQGIQAWGTATSFAQTKPYLTVMTQASYTTCPPLNPFWQVKASHIELNKKTGRGNASNARLLQLSNRFSP